MISKPNKYLSYEKSRMIIPKKSNRYVVVCLIMFLITIVFEGSVSIASEPNDNAAQRAVESFLRQLAEDKITRIEVYYMNLNALTRFSISEDFLRDNHYDYKVIAIDPNLSEIGNSVKEFKFERIDWQSFDFRWGCVFYTEDKEALRLFFPNAPVVSVNGVGYKATQELIISLMQFLPVEAYKEMNEAIKKHWVFSFQKEENR